MALKLIKVAKDFNVGLHSIVETLHARGFTHVEERPTTEITDEMLAVLQKEFQKALAIKQEADKLLRAVLKKDPVPAAAPPTVTPPQPVQVNRPALLPRQEPANVTPPPPLTAEEQTTTG